QDPVGPAHADFSSFTSSRISEMEIAGRKRRKERNRNAKKAIEPKRKIQSHAVGMKFPQADGMKSWCMLWMTITARSVHMPTLTTRRMAKSSHADWRARRNQRICGAATLQKRSSQ